MPNQNGSATRVNWLVRINAEAKSIPFLPSAGLILLKNSDEPIWRANDGRAGFVVDSDMEGLQFPGGWYLLEGMLRSRVGMQPSIEVAYSGIQENEVIVLPSPAGGGHLRMLLLFKYPVSKIFFRPDSGAVTFTMRDFMLCRTSRRDALREMLTSSRTFGIAAVPAALRFLVGALFNGLSRATSSLYQQYRARRVSDIAPTDPYDDWVLRFDTLDADRLRMLAERSADAERTGPTISILLPVYQTDERWLRKCIESVLGQVYAKWELCISDDASPGEEVREIIKEYATLDSRIRYVFRDANGHISASSNSALDLATGEYVALLDHDDELRPHALLAVAEAVLANPSFRLVYSDEDKIDAEGRRFQPNFKPDWNPDLLRSQNFICHLTVIETGLVRQVGGFRSGFEGSQDHDLILRCIEHLSEDQIHHVPEVLYHWRAIEGSTALSRGAKDYAADAGARAVQEHLQRIGSGATIEQLPHGHYRVRWPIPDPPCKISLVIPTRDKAVLLRTCIESILSRTTYPNFEILVVDNQSSEPEAIDYLHELQSVDRVRVLRYDADFNYSAINNWAVSQCDGVIIGLINNDIEVITPQWLEELTGHALRPEVGAVGAMLYYPDDRIQHAGVILGIGGVANHAYLAKPRGYPGHGARALVAQNLSAVTGACLLVRRSVYQAVGGLDERLAVAFNDIDFCLRLREAGYSNVWTPFAELYHHESASRGADDNGMKRARFVREVEFMQRRWGRSLHNDPAYNPNLTLDISGEGFASPPRC